MVEAEARVVDRRHQGAWRVRRWLPVGALCLIAATGWADAGPAVSAGDGSEIFDQAVERHLGALLAPLLLAPDDLSIAPDFVAADPYRLPVVDACLLAAHRVPAVLDSIGTAWEAPAPRSLGGLVRAMSAAWGFAVPDRPTTAERAPHTFTELIDRFDAGAWRVPLARAFAGLSDDERREIVVLAEEQLELESDRPDLAIDAVIDAEEAAERASERFLALVGRVDRPALTDAMVAAADFADLVAAGAAGVTGAGGPDAPPATGDVLAWGRLRDGRWAVLGGSGPTVYTGACGVIVDLGGDDT